MLIKIAWRNIWRAKVRSFVVITAIALGLWAGVFASAFVQGMFKSKVDSVVEKEISHFQFHAKGFRDEPTAAGFMEESAQIDQELRQDPEVKGVSGRLISMGMIGSANQNGSIRILGIEPTDEAMTTRLPERLVEGEYFEGIKRNPILISRETAQKFRVKLRSKVVLTMQDVDGEITAGAFRVVGIYSTENNMYDKMNAFVRRSDLAKLMKVEEGVHEIAVYLNNYDLAESMADKYEEKYSELEVLPWLDLSLGMRLMISMIDTYLYIIVGIILLALLFGIVNTMLMAVLERVREIGMLMAIGMTKMRVFGMIMLETIFLSMIGGPLGLLISYLFVLYFGEHGIHLTGAGYEDFGFSSHIYPYLDAARYFDVAFMVLGMAIVAAIYPARKALKLKPVNAIRKI
jgi:putative ABC transport system permease protein